MGEGREDSCEGKKKINTEPPSKPLRKGKIQDLSVSNPKDKEHTLRTWQRKRVLQILGPGRTSWTRWVGTGLEVGQA